MNKKYILIGLISFIGFLSLYFLYSFTISKKDLIETYRDVDLSESNQKKYFVNKINGTKYFTDSEPEFFNNRPLAVMINNATPARPQAGIEKADITYEIVAEGGITRFLSIFYSELPQKVGPIRSVREYYLPIVKEIGDAMFMHIGYSPQAQLKIKEWEIRSLSFQGAYFYRDNGGDSTIATEHTAFASAGELFKFGQGLGWGENKEFKTWKFKDDSFDKNNITAKNIKIDFWYEGDYTAYFEFDPNKNEYVRYSGKTQNGFTKLLDRDSGKEVRLKNLIVQFANEVPIPNDDKGRLDYEMLGKGKALVFTDGVFKKVTWEKKSLNDRTMFYLENGDEVEFNRGKIWVSIVPSRNENQVYYSNN